MKNKLKPIDGVLLVDKPAGPTSHSIVSQIKRLLHPERIGHLGTLDPFASGLLPILLGGATKLADKAMEASKGYLFRIALGTETDTLDLQGRVVKTSHQKVQSVEPIEAALQGFRGAVRQIPPAYSALKKDGRPLYEYMRAEGQLPFDIEEKARIVNIYELNLLNFNAPDQTIDLEVICAKGTYVRCLARDISYALGTVGHCSQLRRHKVGHWTSQEPKLVNAENLDDLNLLDFVMQPHNVAPQLPRFKSLCPVINLRLLSGNPIEVTDRTQIEALNAEAEKIMLLKGQAIGPSASENWCLFESVSGLQYLAEYLSLDHAIVVRPKRKTQTGLNSKVNLA